MGRSRFLGVALACAWLLAGVVTAAWALQAGGPDGRQALGAASWLASGAAAAYGWWRSPAGELDWDGGQWHFASCEAAAPDVALDLQRGLLLHLRVEGRSLWLWCSRAEAPSYWEQLRRAVYSRASTAAPHGPHPPVASP